MAKTKKLPLKTLNKWIIGLGLLRILLVFLPQTGYIHPDEYFQSVEVLAGKVFDVDYSPPWEFNTTLPIRGITIPYFTTGLSYIFLRDIHSLAIEYLSINLVTPYFLLVIPRFIIGLLSFIVDYCLMKVCVNNNEKYESRLIVLGSSYVMLVYGSRTFSNTLELILFALLLFFVCESQTFSNELLRKEEYINYRYEKSRSVVEKAKFHKLKLYLVPDNYRNCIIVSTITVFGMFSRPTFLIFALIPIFFWVYRGTGHKRVSVTQFHTRMVFLALCSIPAILFNVIIDSFFYGYLTWGEIGMLEVSIDNFVVTPLNFIRYNAQTANLAKHGLHPKYLHLLVNVPLLFNVLGLVALGTLLKYFYWAYQKKFALLPSIRSIKLLMTMSFITPILLLSIFPHQEARFLIPALFPMVYLHSEQILPEPDKTLVKAPEVSVVPKTVKKQTNIFVFYLVLNAIFLFFFGFVHQGGIYGAMEFLHKDVKFSPKNTEFHIVTSHIYSLPQSFLLQKSPDKLFYNNKIKYAVKKRVFLDEKGSKVLDLTHLKALKSPYKIYLLVPYSQYFNALKTLQMQQISAKMVDKFWPHLSTESWPDFSHYCASPFEVFFDNCEVLPLMEYLRMFYEMLELHLYELKFNENSQTF